MTTPANADALPKKRGYQADNALRHGHTLNRQYSPIWKDALAAAKEIRRVE
jgi:hypothetical protein